MLDRVRRMPIHSPLAAFLAGVELGLRKAQDWEQNAHRGVSLIEELRPLSALVVRWRAVELKTWPKLLDDRERSYALKVIQAFFYNIVVFSHSASCKHLRSVDVKCL